MGLRKFLCVAALLCFAPGLVSAQAITQADVDAQRGALEDWIDFTLVDAGWVAEDEMGAFYLKRPGWASAAPAMDVPSSVACEDLEAATDALSRMRAAWLQMNSISDDFTSRAAQAKAARVSGDAATSLGQKYYTFMGGNQRAAIGSKDILDFATAVESFSDAVDDWHECGLTY